MVVRSRKRRVIAQSTCSSQKVRSATSFLVRVGVNLSQEMSTSKCRRVLRAGTQCSNHCHADFCQFNVFTFCKATYRDRADDGAFNIDWQTATPADVAGIAEIGDIKARLGITCRLAKLPARFALTRRSPRFVTRNQDGRERRAVHAQ